MFFQGGSGGGFSEEEYQAYVQQLQAEREERIKRINAEQQLVDSLDDPTEKIEAQRQRYKCGEDFLTINEIPKWNDLSIQFKQKHLQDEEEKKKNAASSGDNNKEQLNNEKQQEPEDARARFMMSFFSRRPTLQFEATDKQTRYSIDDQINSKIALIRGDITTLEVDGVVNAANSSLMGGGGVDGAIHSAAGPLLENECRGLNGAETGETKITRGYALPAKYILHTVGPIERGDRQLRACYKSSLDLCVRHGLKTVAFCCISTGIYGFPLKRATHIALDECRKFLNQLKEGTYAPGPFAGEEKNENEKKNKKENKTEEEDTKAAGEKNADEKNKNENDDEPIEEKQQQQPGIDAIEKIIFCVFTAEELQCYETLLGTYFPIQGFYTEKYDPSTIDPEKLDDFNRDDARTWGSSRGGGGGGDGMGVINMMGGV